MSDEELKRLRELCDAARPGPWAVGQRTRGEWEVVVPLPRSSIDGVPVAGVYGTARLKETTAFIAATRTALPALLDEVERLRAVEKVALEAEGILAAHLGWAYSTTFPGSTLKKQVRAILGGRKT